MYVCNFYRRRDHISFHWILKVVHYPKRIESASTHISHHIIYHIVYHGFNSHQTYIQGQFSCFFLLLSSGLLFKVLCKYLIKFSPISGTLYLNAHDDPVLFQLWELDPNVIHTVFALCNELYGIPQFKA